MLEGLVNFKSRGKRLEFMGMQLSKILNCKNLSGHVSAMSKLKFEANASKIKCWSP